MNINLKDTYFSKDGSYGHHFVVINTDKWTESDWQKVENCSDSERIKIAIRLAQKKAGRA